MQGNDFDSRFEATGFYIIVAFLLFYSFFPALWLLLTSLKRTKQIIHVPIQFIPDPVVFSQYKDVFAKAPFDRFILNSLVVSIGSTLLCIFIATLASYALARLDVPGKNVFLVSFLLISTFPLIALMVPLFKIFRELRLLNTYWALILPYTVFSLPIAIWILTTFFREIPDDLEEAARIDGCSRVSALVRVVFPLSAPGVATAAMISFVNSWNEFTLAFSLMSERSMYTLPVGITYLKDQYAVPWGLISSGIIIAIVPLIILIIFFQKRLISGLTAGAIKG